jgi:hypothetical protein
MCRGKERITNSNQMNKRVQAGVDIKEIELHDHNPAIPDPAQTPADD